MQTKYGTGTYGIFCLLLMLAGARERRYRGWLLDHRNQPAGPKLLAALTHAPEAAIRRALRVLSREDIGLLERVPLPDFDAISVPASRRAGSRGGSGDGAETPGGGNSAGPLLDGDGTAGAGTRTDSCAGERRGGDPDADRSIATGVSGDGGAARPGAPGRAGGHVYGNGNGLRPPERSTATASASANRADANASAVPDRRPPKASGGDAPSGQADANADANAATDPGPRPPRAAGEDAGGQADERAQPTADGDGGDGDGEGAATPTATPTAIVRDLPGGVCEIELSEGGGGPPPAGAEAEAEGPTRADPAPGGGGDIPAVGAAEQARADPRAGADRAGPLPPRPGPPRRGPHPPGPPGEPEAVAGEIYAAVYPSPAAEAAGARQGGDGSTPIGLDRFRCRERAAFAGVWASVLCLGLSDGELAELRRRLVGEAGALGKKGIGRVRKTRGAILIALAGRIIEERVGPARWAAAKRGLRLSRSAAG